MKCKKLVFAYEARFTRKKPCYIYNKKYYDNEEEVFKEINKEIEQKEKESFKVKPMVAVVRYEKTGSRIAKR